MRQPGNKADSRRRRQGAPSHVALGNPPPPGPRRPPAESNFLSVTTWTIVEKSDKYEKVDARTIHFEVEVPANGKKTVSYTVRYTW